MLLLCGLALAAADLLRPPQRQLGARAAVAAIRIYRRALSPALDPLGARCRFTPTCSSYAVTVVGRFGLLRGTWLTARRIARCGPWTPAGTVDQPPPAPPMR